MDLERWPPDVPIQESIGSKDADSFIVGNGDTIPNEGEKDINYFSVWGEEQWATFQIADGIRPLASVGEMCDANNLVIFAQGGLILNLESRTVTPIQRNGQLYELEMWRKSPKQSPPPPPPPAPGKKQFFSPGFTRPGA